MKYISSMFKNRYQDCVQRYSGLSDYDSLCIKLMQIIHLNWLSVQRSGLRIAKC